MENSVYIAILLVFFVLLLHRKENEKAVVAKRIISKKGNVSMTETAKMFLNKECIVYTFNGTQITGIIKQVTDKALLIESKNTKEAVNLDYVMRIREYPLNKNGKKKSIIVD